MKERLTIEIDQELKRTLKSRAASEGRTIKEIVEKIINNWLSMKE